MEMIYRWELMLERRNISTREIASWQQKSRMKTVKMIDATMLEYTKINDELCHWIKVSVVVANAQSYRSPCGTGEIGRT